MAWDPYFPNEVDMEYEECLRLKQLPCPQVGGCMVAPLLACAGVEMRGLSQMPWADRLYLSTHCLVAMIH